jgi:hypothetical protein
VLQHASLKLSLACQASAQLSLLRGAHPLHLTVKLRECVRPPAAAFT